MRADTANGGINQLEDHYKTFIVEYRFSGLTLYIFDRITDREGLR
jgi:hypothetical protein